MHDSKPLIVLGHSMFNLDTRRPIGEYTEKALETGATAVTLDDEEPWCR